VEPLIRGGGVGIISASKRDSRSFFHTSCIGTQADRYVELIGTVPRVQNATYGNFLSHPAFLGSCDLFL